MSRKGRGRNNNEGHEMRGGNGMSMVPSGSRKVVHSLKEIVNCPEHEIYAMLQECDMDPNEAASRLLSQDTFHEVKSKREKKRENKSTHRGLNGGVNHNEYAGSTKFGLNEASILHRKPAQKENGTHAHPASALLPGMPKNSISQGLPPPHSDSVDAGYSVSTVDGGNGVASSSLSSHSSVSKCTWSRVPGQMSMAEVVKMGLEPHKPSSSLPSLSNEHHDASASSVVHFDSHSIVNFSFKGANNAHFHNEWPCIQQPLATDVPVLLEVPPDTENSKDNFILHLDMDNQHKSSKLNTVESAEDGLLGSTVGNCHARSSSVSSSSARNDGSGGSNVVDNNLNGNVSSYKRHNDAFQQDEVQVDASPMCTSFQQLSLNSQDKGVISLEDVPAVIIPSHLQIRPPNCQLSFGSFGSGISSAFSASFASIPMEHKLECSLELQGSLSVGHSYARVDSLRNTIDECLVSQGGASGVPQSEVLDATSESSRKNQCNFLLNGQLNSPFNSSNASSQFQEANPFSSEMTLTNSLRRSGPTIHFPPLSGPKSILNSSIPHSLCGPSFSRSEEWGGMCISAQQQQQQPLLQSLSSSTTAPRLPLPQHLPMHQYPQPSLPMGHLPNVIGYPFLPQSYSCLPYPSVGTGSPSPYHHPYRASPPATSRNFSLHPSSVPIGTALGYDASSSQLNNGNQLSALHQNDTQAGSGLRSGLGITESLVPFGLQGLHQQVQQRPLQQFGALGFPNYAQSLDLQQLGGGSGTTPRPSQQAWQNSYN